MDPIREGATGVAVEDIQERLVSLGYAISDAEKADKVFGHSTARAVARFRLDHDLDLGKEVDAQTWSALVDEGYELGDRTLYLRLPNFHGRDVRQLQERLNILGFSCGDVDGNYGVHTEAAVKLFQESVGELADGMAFPDTFDAIDRLRHVWAGKPADGPHPMGGMGFARAAGVLESTRISITGDDPIARNVAGRTWNLASATTTNSGLELVDSVASAKDDANVVLLLSATELPRGGASMPSVDLNDFDTLARRLRTAYESARGKKSRGKKVPVVRIELPVSHELDGSFTVSDSQAFAVVLLDAICSAFDGIEG